MNRLKSVRIRRFKRILDASFELQDLNVLVGANNSGKSSVIQGLHFGVALLQTIALEQRWPANTASFSISLSPNQPIYSPSEDVYALATGGKLYEGKDKAISFELNLASGESCTVTVAKGKNRNIVASVEHADVARRLSSLKEPFSIFSPGLAGVAKREMFVSDGVLLRTLARGDANLVLRNILFRLWKTDKWSDFLTDLHHVFPGVEISIDFEMETAESIEVKVKIGGQSVPLEIAGTGLLQATQILSYIHRFSPSVIVLDEPDSHLHPNNQRLLCSLLRHVAERTGTQVLLTTHSRHVVDAIGAPSEFLWVRDGSVDRADENDEIGVLLDIGALDVKERASQPGISAIVLTEDENTHALGVVLGSSSFDVASTSVLPYYGVTTIKQLRPLVRMIQTTNPKAKIVVHRDRDFMNASEVDEWENAVRALSVDPFVTAGLDIESYFLDADYLAECNAGVTSMDFAKLIEEVLTNSRPTLIEAYVNGRVDISRKAGTYGQLNVGQLAASAPKEIDSAIKRYAGKTSLRALRAEFRIRYGKNLGLFKVSSRIKNDTLAGIAKRVKKPVGGAKAT